VDGASEWGRCKNDEILDVIKVIGVDFAQGYGICHPKPLDEISEVLNNHDYLEHDLNPKSG